MLFVCRHSIQIILVYLLSICICLESIGTAESYFYIIKKFDIASSILLRCGVMPIYGKNGSLQQLRRINPQIEDLDLIYPQQKLNLSENLVERGKALGRISFTEENEIYFLNSNKPIEQKQTQDLISEAAPVTRNRAPLPPQVLETKPASRRTLPKKSIANANKYKLKPQKSSPFTSYITFGLGYTFLNFSQIGSETKKLEYSSLMGPSFSLRGGTEWNKNFGLDTSLASYPGMIKSSQISILNSRFNWTALSLEATMRFNRNKNNYHWRAGIQYHDLPYVQLPTVSSAEVRKHQVYLATFGFDYNFILSKRWAHQLLLRLQTPFAQSQSSDNIQFQSQFAFDGSVGTSYTLNRHFNLGLFWYGQWQEYKYSMQSLATGQEDKGTNKFFFSNLEFRLGYLF